MQSRILFYSLLICSVGFSFISSPTLAQNVTPEALQEAKDNLRSTPRGRNVSEGQVQRDAQHAQERQAAKTPFGKPPPATYPPSYPDASLRGKPMPPGVSSTPATPFGKPPAATYAPNHPDPAKRGKPMPPPGKSQYGSLPPINGQAPPARNVPPPNYGQIPPARPQAPSAARNVPPASYGQIPPARPQAPPSSTYSVAPAPAVLPQNQRPQSGQYQKVPPQAQSKPYGALPKTADNYGKLPKTASPSADAVPQKVSNANTNLGAPSSQYGKVPPLSGEGQNRRDQFASKKNQRVKKDLNKQVKPNQLPKQGTTPGNANKVAPKKANTPARKLPKRPR